MGIARWEVPVWSRCEVQAASDDLVIVVPGGQAVGHLGAIVIGGEPMAAGPEMRGDHAEHRQEALGCAGGGEAFHGAFALPGRLVGVFCSVEVLRQAVLDRRRHRPMRHLIAWELVGDQHPRYPALLGQQLTEEPETNSSSNARAAATDRLPRGRCKRCKTISTMVTSHRQARTRYHRTIVSDETREEGRWRVDA